METQELTGGLANFGQVYRRGDAVERPAGPQAAALHAFLRGLKEAGFDGAPEPISLDEQDGREELTFIAGDVALPPFPAWSTTDEALASVGRLLRRYHDAAAQVPVPDAAWQSEMADPEGGPILCHNDVCQENVVFRAGEASALIDFDLAAPGRPVWDLAFCAWYWVPAVPRDVAYAEGLGGLDPAARLRVLADGYGLDEAGRRALIDVFPQVADACRRFVAARVAAGDPVFVKIDAERDPRRWDEIAKWLAVTREPFLAALLD